jgi:valyl-tRNA synthetase
MKKILLATLITVSNTLLAQVYVGANLHNGEEKRSYSVLTQQESKELVDDLEKYMGQFGKVTKPGKNIFRIQNLKGNTVSSDLNYIDVVSKSTKKLEKLEFFFLNDAHNALSDHELNPGGAEKFVQDFINYAQTQTQARLRSENISLAEDELKEAKRDQNKIEKSIENNLKEQQKLGKKLDSSPELMAKALSEKEIMVTQLSTDSTAVLDEKAKTELSKATQKKDKEISKLQKEAEKTEEKLEKKEKELEELKTELNQVKRRVKSLENIVIDAKSFK